MAVFEILAEHCLGMSHCGSVDADGEGTIELSDEDIKKLNIIMEEATDKGENLETFDLRDTNLEESDPKLYQKFYDAYYDAAFEGEYEHWIVEGYWNWDVLEGLDWERAEEVCEDNYGYDPEEDEDGFQQWFWDNIVGKVDLVKFHKEWELLDVYMDEFDFDSPLRIPKELVKKFLEQLEA